MRTEQPEAPALSGAALIAARFYGDDSRAERPNALRRPSFVSVEELLAPQRFELRVARCAEEALAR